MITPSKRKGWYTAVCLELGIIREGRDVFGLQQQINKLAARYVASAVKHNLSDELLNQKLPKSYVDKYRRLEGEHDRQIKEKWERIVRAIIWQQRIRGTKLLPT